MTSSTRDFTPHRLVGDQAELWPDWPPLLRDQPRCPVLTADIDHRDHAMIDIGIRDLKDQARAHFPSSRMHANSAWRVIAALAHNLARSSPS